MAESHVPRPMPILRDTMSHKSTTVIGMLLAVTVSVSAACGGDSVAPSPTGGASNPGANPPSGVVLSNGSMSATVSGVRWDANAVITVVYRAPSGGAEGTIAINGINSAQQLIGIGVGHTGPGTYKTEGLHTGFGYLERLSNMSWAADRPDVAPGSTGTVTFTTLTGNRAVGTFSFTAVASPNTAATGTRVVTNGLFDVTF